MNDHINYEAPAIAEVGSIIEQTAGTASSGPKLDGSYKKGTKIADLKFYPAS